MKNVLSRFNALITAAAVLLSLCLSVFAVHLISTDASEEIKSGEMAVLHLSELFSDSEGHSLRFSVKNNDGNRATTPLQGDTYYFTTPEAGVYHPVLTAACSAESADVTLTITVTEPEGELPRQYDYDETPAEAVTVFVTVSSDGIPLMGNDDEDTVLLHLPVTVPYFELESCGLEDFNRYGTENGSGSYVTDEVIRRPTALHLYIYLLERYYLGASEEDWLEQAADLPGAPGGHGVRNMFGDTAYDDQCDALWITGSATSMYMQQFWGHDENLMYYRNHVYPLMSPGWGSTADYILLSDGDTIDLAMFTDWGFYHHGAFAAFDRETYCAAAGSELTVGARQFGTQSVSDGGVDDFTPMEGLSVLLFDDKWVPVADAEETGDGDYTLTLPSKAGTYHLLGLDPDAGTDTACIAPATAEVTVTENRPPLKIKNVTIALESDISIQFFVADEVVAGCTAPYMAFEKQLPDGTKVTQTVTDYVLDGNGYHIYSFTGLTAVEMATPVTASFHDGEERSSNPITYSVQTHVRNLLNRTKSTSLRRLLVDLLCYGDAAQYNFSYATDNLATSVLTATEKAWADKTLTAPVNITAMQRVPGATIGFRQCSLSTRDKVTINYHLNLDAYKGRPEDLELLVHYTDGGREITKTVDSSDFVIRRSGGKIVSCIVPFDGLNATQMRTACTAELRSKTDPTVVSNRLVYSIESYVSGMLNTGDEKLKTLLTAMLSYGDACQSYFTK